MREHHLYDAKHSDTKFPNSFTGLINAYGAPFYYQYPHDTMKDFSGVVHEFGYYNNSYYSGFAENQHYITTPNECADTTEVHSQGFELFFPGSIPKFSAKTPTWRRSISTMACSGRSTSARCMTNSSSTLTPRKTSPWSSSTGSFMSLRGSTAIP